MSADDEIDTIPLTTGETPNKMFSTKGGGESSDDEPEDLLLSLDVNDIQKKTNAEEKTKRGPVKQNLYDKIIALVDEHLCEVLKEEGFEEFMKDKGLGKSDVLARVMDGTQKGPAKKVSDEELELYRSIADGKHNFRRPDGGSCPVFLGGRVKSYKFTYCCAKPDKSGSRGCPKHKAHASLAKIKEKGLVEYYKQTEADARALAATKLAAVEKSGNVGKITRDVKQQVVDSDDEDEKDFFKGLIPYEHDETRFFHLETRAVLAKENGAWAFKGLANPTDSKVRMQLTKTDIAIRDLLKANGVIITSGYSNI